MSARSVGTRIAAVVAALLMLGAAPGRAQDADGRGAHFEQALLDRLVGHWRVERRMGDRVLANTCDAEWVLNHQFLRLHYRDVATPPAYEAMVFLGWNGQQQRVSTHWIDVFGGRYSETLGFGAVSGDSLVLDFAYPDGAFRNTYRWYPATGEWTSRGESQDSTGAWQPFMTDRFRRARTRR